MPLTEYHNFNGPEDYYSVLKTKIFPDLGLVILQKCNEKPQYLAILGPFNLDKEDINIIEQAITAWTCAKFDKRLKKMNKRER